jgi:dTDP-3-amino-3,4,6-trideoxy-alpha-D-glucose transaminase
MSVPLFDTKTPLAPLRDALHAKAAEVLDAGRYILGPEVTAFEEELATHLATPHAIGVANGTDALVLALRAMGVGPGDDVVVPSFTFYASAEAIAVIGANPVFCDIDPVTFCATPETVRAALTPNTKVVMVVHLFGNIAPVEAIAALGVPVLEDAAQAAGSRTADGRRAGALGAAATFSFFPSKNLGAFGDGGAVATGDDALAEKVRMLRFHGSRDKVSFELVGE